MATIIIVSFLLFVAAALCEIGGGYLVWLWLREKRGKIFGLVGALALFIYAVALTLQPAHFGRVYAVYGGIFIVSSILWGLFIDKRKPDRYDVIGAVIVIVGVLVIMYWPRV